MCAARWPAELLKCNSLTRRGMLFRRCHSSSRREKQSRLMLTGSRRLRAGWRVGRQPLALQQHNHHSPQPPTSRRWRLEPGQLWIYVLTPAVCCAALVYCAHRTYKGGMRPDSALERAAAEKVQVKLFSQKKAGMALEQQGRIVVHDARRLVAKLPKGEFRWTDQKLQLSAASLNAIMQWQAVAGQYLQQLS